MCDYSLELVASRPAKVGDKLVSTSFPHTITRGFASADDRNVAVCLLPGTELAFDYEVRCETPEFTCVCPMTGQPDFATVTITYVPEAKIVELKSLKLYLWSYRDEGAFHEDVTNRILDDLLAVLSPRQMTVHTLWNVRGGITTQVTASHP